MRKICLFLFACLFLIACKDSSPTTPTPPSKPHEIWCTLNFKIKVTNFLLLLDGNPQNFGDIQIEIRTFNEMLHWIYPLPPFGETLEKELEVVGFKTGRGYSFKCTSGLDSPNWQGGNVKLLVEIISLTPDVIITPSKFEESFWLSRVEAKQFDFSISRQ